MGQDFGLHQVFQTTLLGYCAGLHPSQFLPLLWAATSEGEIVALATTNGSVEQQWTADPLGLQYFSGSAIAQVLLTAGHTGTLQFWQEDGKRIAQIDMPNAWLDAAAWSPGGHAVALCMGRTIVLANASGEVSWSNKGMTFTGTALAWSLNGEQIAVAGNGVIAFFQAQTGEIIRKIHWRAAFISLHWGHDPNFLFSGTHDGTLHVWKLDELEPHHMAMQGYDQPVTLLASCPSGIYLAVPSHTNLVLWHLKNSMGLRKSVPAIDGRHLHGITALSFRPGSTSESMLASGDQKGQLLLSGIKNHALFTQGQGQAEGEITSLAWLPGVHHLAAGTAQGHVHYFSFA